MPEYGVPLFAGHVLTARRDSVLCMDALGASSPAAPPAAVVPARRADPAMDQVCRGPIARINCACVSACGVMRYTAPAGQSRWQRSPSAVVQGVGTPAADVTDAGRLDISRAARVRNGVQRTCRWSLRRCRRATRSSRPQRRSTGRRASRPRQPPQTSVSVTGPRLQGAAAIPRHRPSGSGGGQRVACTQRW